MACFLVPATEAVITTIAQKCLHKQEQKAPQEQGTLAFFEKKGWLNKMLWGGSALLAFEQLWSGEIKPFFPFLTNAVTDPSTMLHEMATVGVGMSALVTAVWVGMVLITGKKRLKRLNEESSL